MRFDGRVAIVTGASMGLGRRFALDLARRGATVVGVARGADALAQVDREITRTSPGSWTETLDVGDPEAVHAFVDAVAGRHGRIDLLLNNAAIEERAGVATVDLDAVRKHMRINFEGTVAATLAAVPHMRARGEGWIVGVSSGVARAPIPMEGAYAASKAAMVAFLECLSYELEREGVRVKVLFPGFVVTTRMAQGSLEQGMPEPPRSVRRTEGAVSKALFDGLDRPGFEINTSRAEAIAPAARVLAPRLFRANVRKLYGG